MLDHAITGDHSTDAARILATIPTSLRDVSGTAPYTGLASWTQPSPLYVMGYNPGGDPADISRTVAENAANLFHNLPANYSAYRDEMWSNGRGGEYAVGQHPMQKAMLHVLGRLGLDPGLVPTSNLFYARSRRAHHVAAGDARTWIEACWPFHAAMFERLQTRVVLCLGRDSARYVRSKVGSNTVVETFRENNGRGTSTTVYSGGSVTVVDAAHPSRSSWWTPECDITPLVARALSGDHPVGPERSGAAADQIVVVCPKCNMTLLPSGACDTCG
jgi:hypothetical protein